MLLRSRRFGHEAEDHLTPRAAELVSPQLFEALTGRPAQSDEFGEHRAGGMDHITLAKWSEAFVVAPATADLVSRLALGLAGDLVATVALALEPQVPRLLCPAMNPNMLQAGPVARNLETLRSDGWNVFEPGSGHMACGDHGPGRMGEPPEIVAALKEILG